MLHVAELYQAYSASVRASCRAVLRDAVAAEDATQETFLRVQRHLDAAERVDDVGAWIHRIAFNYCLNEVRNRSQRGSRLSLVGAQDWTWDEDDLLARDQMRRLLRALPDQLRVLIQLRYLEGRDQGHIAGQLGVSRRTVVSRLAELRERLERVALQAP